MLIESDTNFNQFKLLEQQLLLASFVKFKLSIEAKELRLVQLQRSLLRIRPDPWHRDHSNARGENSTKKH